jgi:hypothetical protein
LQIGEYVSTSIGLIVTAGEARAPAPSAGRWWTDPWKYVRRKAA